MSRTYDQDICPIARTLDIVGDRWTLLVLRDLMHGRQRYSALLESLEGISTNLLSDRLKRLEGRGMIERRFYSEHPPRAEYRLTAKGKAFAPVIRELYRWGTDHEPREGIADPTLEDILRDPSLAPSRARAGR